MDEIKLKIRQAVSDYKKFLPEEYEAIAADTLRKRANYSPTGAHNNGEALERKILEIPETLFSSIKIKLTAEEWDTFNSPKDGKVLSRWMAKEFPAFRAVDEI